MTYQEIVLKVREGFENADAREIFEHVAVQVNIEGEGSGAFYIEIAERYISVEPYDYYDRDGLLTADADTLIAIAKGELPIMEAFESGRLRAEGDPEKLRMLSKIKFTPKKKINVTDFATSLGDTLKLMEDAVSMVASAFGETTVKVMQVVEETTKNAAKNTEAAEKKAKTTAKKTTKAAETKVKEKKEEAVEKVEKVKKTVKKEKAADTKTTEPAEKKTKAATKKTVAEDAKKEEKAATKKAKATVKKEEPKAVVEPKEEPKAEKPAEEKPVKTVKKKQIVKK